MRGETLTITRKGIPIPKLTPFGKDSVMLPPQELRKRFIAFQEAHPLHDITTRDLINEGRRR